LSGTKECLQKQYVFAKLFIENNYLPQKTDIILPTLTFVLKQT